MEMVMRHFFRGVSLLVCRAGGTRPECLARFTERWPRLNTLKATSRR